MKKIEAIIRPHMFTYVKESLDRIGYNGLTVTEVEGHGRQGGVTQFFRGRKYNLALIPKVKVEIVAAGAKVSRIVKCILKAASTGKEGDGKVFVYGIQEAYQVSSGASGEKVVS